MRRTILQSARRLAMGIAAALVASAVAAAQEMPTIRVPVRLVTLPTRVFSHDGRMIPGLQRKDFRVFDNGVLQETTLDTATAPVSVVLAVQVNWDVREYVPFIAKVGSVVETLLVGETGEAAVVTYNDYVAVAKPFDSGDVASALRKISAQGRQARTIDAGRRAIALLKERPRSRTRVVVFIGQPMDGGSALSLAALREEAEEEGVSLYALALPEFGKSLVSDMVSVQGLTQADKGGFKVSLDLGKLFEVLARSGAADAKTDPFSVLVAATGGTQLHFRKQSELEEALAAIGVELRSAYLLSYAPSSVEPGYHTVKIEVGMSGARAISRSGYWLTAN